jgi:hypothetical protein
LFDSLTFSKKVRITVTYNNQVFDLLTIMVTYQTYRVYDVIVSMIVNFDIRRDTRMGFGATSDTRTHSGCGGFVPGFW